MSCSSIDLKAYFLGEIDRREKAAYEEHFSGCESCRDELDRLRLTQTALLSMADEEVPRRIAFVSDRVFEPRWWQTIWHSGPVMGFASAALLAAAILVHAGTRPAPAPVVTQVAKIDTAQIEQEVSKRVEVAVKKAVGEVETREVSQNAKMLEAAEKRFEFQRRADLVAVQETIRMYQQQRARDMVAANYNGGAQ